MSTETIQIVSCVLAVTFVVIIIARRKSKKKGAGQDSL
ncbi:MAG: hypothetical protein IANPNBLG_02333 [Bryobacteraceae bacterium]|nr:hypothetical protein [Bryobacteraceae bacterium]